MLEYFVKAGWRLEKWWKLFVTQRSSFSTSAFLLSLVYRISAIRHLELFALPYRSCATFEVSKNDKFFNAQGYWKGTTSVASLCNSTGGDLILLVGPTWIDQTWFAYAGLRGGLLWVWGLDAEPICCTMGADELRLRKPCQSSRG